MVNIFDFLFFYLLSFILLFFIAFCFFVFFYLKVREGLTNITGCEENKQNENKNLAMREEKKFLPQNLKNQRIQ